jgi:peroxiredoxin
LSVGVLLFTVVLPWVIVGLVVTVGAWVGFQLIHQNGRLLSRLETLEQRLQQLHASQSAPGIPTAPLPAPPPDSMAAVPAGLPIGSPAPEFDLPDLHGERRSLASYRGRELLLIFFNPRCGFCTQMVPDLAALPVDGADGYAIPVVVSTGDAAENRKLFTEHGVNCPVLLQTAMEVASQYQCHGTPMGCRVDAEGRIASELATGAQALLALASAPTRAQNGHQPHTARGAGANGNGRGALGGKRSVADSKLNRTGLPVGSTAPDFRLPLLDGGELSLSEYRGRKVLLVFSDPNCGPCDQLAPQLEQHARRTAEIQVLMVSRGDSEANRAKAAEHGLTFPIALQRQWEVSREYGMFATPVGYLIDESGVIAADAATGTDAILALLSSASSPAPCRCGRMPGQCGCGKRQPATAKRNGR